MKFILLITLLILGIDLFINNSAIINRLKYMNIEYLIFYKIFVIAVAILSIALLIQVLTASFHYYENKRKENENDKDDHNL